MNPNTAVCIKINKRYFNKFGKNRVQTAWCLAGAKLFIPESDTLTKTINRLITSKKTFSEITIEIE